ncbi:unnamed protein product, partial [Ectocarpus sp. 12 AP-2014]
MSRSPATEASGGPTSHSAVGNTPYRPCRGKDCRPPGPAPTPEPTFHGHIKNSVTGRVSEGFWGSEFSAAAKKAVEASAAPRSSSCGKTPGKKSGRRDGELPEAVAALGTSTEQKEEEGHEQPAACEPQPAQPT